ncbi:hypothetical protein BO86DRAFT_407158 [Aspergillus japonicus CBS 114.51]|uniref:BTB domain-containing protein n=1 Tax=Aspergillus japonicus CBS 114.51 TaxID=1448312 RepID=A0A8T8XB78_ASPJA|nr:hypothetical protein BO86DRAFT_407158 [Aspergillus japonicus CBS 114.51]RAH85331.1 hypothetical protein BO86DRAFT_407158 [Aspergillus japonicus CBS 114.51]
MAGRAGRKRSSSLLAQNRRVKKPVRSSMTKKVSVKAKLMKGGKVKDEEKKEEESTPKGPPLTSPLVSPVVSLIVGPDHRLFVAHEDVLSRATFFDAVLRDQFIESNLNKVVALPDEDPEILSCILEFLYKGDYYPRLLRGDGLEAPAWRLEEEADNENEMQHNAEEVLATKPVHTRSNNNDGSTGPNTSPTATFHHHRAGLILRDTAIYCAAEHYGLPEALKRLALRKQGLRTGIAVEVILRSARFAYEHTPESEDQLRARYLAMIIRSRAVFKASGTMQLEMERGHPFFFDLFVALCNHVDDLEGRVAVAE